MPLWPSRRQWKGWTLPSKYAAIALAVGVPAGLITLVMFVLYVCTPPPATREGQAESLSQHDETQRALEELRSESRSGDQETQRLLATALRELSELSKGERSDVQGVELPAGFDRAKLDARYPLGWAFFFGYGSRLVADRRSFRTIEVVEWPNMRVGPKGAMFNGGEVTHKIFGGGWKDTGVFVPGRGRWSPFQIVDTCVWFELLGQGDAGALGVVGFARPTQVLPGTTLFSDACRG